MAEFVMKDLVKKQNRQADFYIASAATSTEEIGNPVYPPARRKLAEVGICADGKYAIQLRKSDYDKYDYLIGMDSMNIHNIMRIIGNDSDNKVYKLRDFTNNPGDIADPWYSGDFDTTYEQVLEGCQKLLETIE